MSTLEKPEIDPVPSELEQLFSEHAGAVRAVLRGLLRHSEDVEDCLQATLLVASTRLSEVVPGARRAWLIQVARNKALELIRRGATTKQVLEKLTHNPTTQSDRLDNPAELAIHHERLKAVTIAVQSLPDAQREVVHLKIYEGLTFQEISHRLQIPLGTALTRMRLAMNRLAEKLESFESNPNE